MDSLDWRLVMKIVVPDDISDEFLIFLDIAQSSFSVEDVEKFSKKERKTLRFIERLIKAPAKRMTFAQKRESAKRLVEIMKL